MADAPVSPSVRRPFMIPRRKFVHISILSFAFLLPFLTWEEAAGAALLALFFNLVLLPRLQLDLRKNPAKEEASAGLWTGIVAYPVSVLALILLFGRRMEVVGAVWAIMALGDGLASVAGESWRSRALPWNPGKSFSGFLAFVLAGSAGSYALSRWIAPSLPAGKMLVICLVTSIVGAIVESIPISLDDNYSVPMVCGAFMYCLTFVQGSALASNLPYLGRRAVLAVIVTGAFGLLALGVGAANRSGAAVGFVLAVAIYMGYGYKSFLLMLSFVLIGSIATRLGYAQKAARGTAERRRGKRSWREAVANSLPAAFFALLVITTHHERAFLVALIAALAEAASDTTSSEIGQWLAGRAYLITTFQPVPVGEDGGVSVGGSLAGAGAAMVVVAIGLGVGLCHTSTALFALGAALVGNIVDSFMGATLERRRLVNNAIVNFTCSSLAGGLALGLMLSLRLS